MYIMYDFKVGRLGLQGKPYLGSRKGVPGVTERGTGVGRGVITSVRERKTVPLLGLKVPQGPRVGACSE